MNIVQEKVDDLNAVIKVSIGPEDYKESVMAQLKDYAKKADLKGFRKGKVPINVVKKMYGESVLLEEINKTLSSKLSEYISSEELDILGQPLPRKLDSIDLDIDAEPSYDFEYEIGLAPKVEVNYELKNVPPLYNVEIDDAYLDEELGRLLKRYGDMSNPEESEEGDILFGKLIVSDDDKSKVPAGFVLGAEPASMVALNPERIPSKKLLKEMGKKKKEGDVLSGLKMSEVFKDDEETTKFWELSGKKEEAEALAISEEDLKVINGLTYDFKVKRINRTEAAEINQELFDKVFGPDTVKSEEEFKNKMKEDLEDFLKGDREKYFRSKTIEGLIEAHALALPDEFLKKWLLESSKELTPDRLDKEYDDYSKSLRWSLIVREIRRANEDLEVKEEDVRAHVRELVIKQYGQMMQGEVSDEQIDSIVDYTMQDEKSLERTYQELVDERVFDYMKEKLAPKEKKIKASEYIKLS